MSAGAAVSVGVSTCNTGRTVLHGAARRLNGGKEQERDVVPFAQTAVDHDVGRRLWDRRRFGFGHEKAHRGGRQADRDVLTRVLLPLVGDGSV